MTNRFTIKVTGPGGRYVCGLSRQRNAGFVLSDEPHYAFETREFARIAADDLERRFTQRRASRGTLYGPHTILRVVTF